MAKGVKGGKIHGGTPKRTGTSSGGRKGDPGTSNVKAGGKTKKGY